jgi:hypothetical protein
MQLNYTDSSSLSSFFFFIRLARYRKGHKKKADWLSVKVAENK